MHRASWAIFIAAALCLAPIAKAAADAYEASEEFKKGNFAGVITACEAAAKAGNASCQIFLGVLYSEGKGVKADPVAAARWFRLAAEQGNPVGALNLGLAYERGTGVPKDMKEAEKWYTLAASKGEPYGQMRLALILIGRNDWKEALKLLRPAAAQGVPVAEMMLGLAYESGKGARRNEHLAVKWVETAADRGLTPAQSHLAGLYERGQMVETDFKEAYFWYTVALRDAKNPSRQNDEAGLKRVAAKLSKRDADEAASLARDWSPKEVEIGAPRRTAKEKAPAAPSASRGPQMIATGSGFYVTRQGDLVTNNHVVAACGEVRVTEDEKGVPAKIVAVDTERDLALVRLSHPVNATAIFRNDVARLGENIVVVGFPLSGLLSSDAIVTSGIVSALAGARNDRRHLQISAPMQPGNSGGPVFDPSGHIVGVAVASLSTMRLAQATGAIPENINFAVKGDEAKQFLAAHGVKIETAPDGKELSVATIAEQALKATVRLECWK